MLGRNGKRAVGRLKGCLGKVSGVQEGDEGRRRLDGCLGKVYLKKGVSIIVLLSSKVTCLFLSLFVM